MAGEQVPGPLNQVDKPIDVDDGTMPRIATPLPGPIGWDATALSTSLLASGPEAIKRAAEILETTRNLPDPLPFPSQFGDIPLKRGMLSEDKYIIIQTDWATTGYLDGPRLYSLRTSDFVRNIWLDALAEGANRARHWVAISQVVMSFATGLLAGPLVIVTADVIVLVLWASAHEDLVKLGYNALGPAYKGLGDFKSRYPTLWSKLKTKLGEEFVKNLEDALKETVTDPKNIAFFLGRVLRGMPGGPKGIPPSVPVGKILFVIVECAALVTLLHLPEGFVHLTEKQLRDLADGIKKSFEKAEIGIGLTQVEAQAIANELSRDPQREALSRDLQRSLTDLKKLFEQFESDMKDLSKK